MKDFADDNLKFEENDRKLFKPVENNVGKGEIACYKQFLLFPQCFQKASFPGRQKVSLCGIGLRESQLKNWESLGCTNLINLLGHLGLQTLFSTLRQHKQLYMARSKSRIMSRPLSYIIQIIINYNFRRMLYANFFLTTYLYF